MTFCFLQGFENATQALPRCFQVSRKCSRLYKTMYFVNLGRKYVSSAVRRQTAEFLIVKSSAGSGVGMGGEEGRFGAVKGEAGGLL